MIINTGCRTDIPAFFSEWFINRIKAGYVLVRNPYYPEQVSRYRLTPDIVDCLIFCTKNPQPMLAKLGDISHFGQFWFVTITPYGKEIEPNVPDKEAVMESLISLSKTTGKHAVGWRYDPIFITERYSVEYHIDSFRHMAGTLSGYVDNCVISFIDLYEKTKRNFSEARVVTTAERARIGEAFAGIGREYGITIRSCCEGTDLQQYGVDISGCMTASVIERAIDYTLDVPRYKKSTRSDCDCLMGNDIGMYHTCDHGCVYCYANDSRAAVEENLKYHDPKSPFLSGGFKETDQMRDAKQQSFLDGQIRFNL